MVELATGGDAVCDTADETVVNDDGGSPIVLDSIVEGSDNASEGPLGSVNDTPALPSPVVIAVAEGDVTSALEKRLLSIGDEDHDALLLTAEVSVGDVDGEGTKATEEDETNSGDASDKEVAVVDESEGVAGASLPADEGAVEVGVEESAVGVEFESEVGNPEKLIFSADHRITKHQQNSLGGWRSR